MTSATHQNFVLLFQRHPELTFELARRSGVPLSDGYERLEQVDAEFEDPLWTADELENGRKSTAINAVRADLAIAGHVDGKPRRALALEVQLDHDAKKEWTIVLYRAGLRRKLECPAWALVFSPEPKVRARVQERMFLEEPELRPHVVKPEKIPIIRDLDAAIANYPWAVLAATMHATGPDAVLSATLAIRALLCVAPEDYGRYIQLVAASVGEDIMQQVREQLPPDDQEELSEWERRGSMFTRGHAEGFGEGLERGRAQGLQQGLERGLEQGLEQGLERGLEQGLVEGLRAALRTVLQTRGLHVDDHAREQIAACSDVDELRELVARAATITTADALFSS